MHEINTVMTISTQVAIGSKISVEQYTGYVRTCTAVLFSDIT